MARFLLRRRLQDTGASIGVVGMAGCSALELSLRSDGSGSKVATSGDSIDSSSDDGIGVLTAEYVVWKDEETVATVNYAVTTRTSIEGR